MKPLIAVALTVSLVANAWLLAWSPSAATRELPADPSGSSPKAGDASAVVADANVPIALFEGDPAALRDALRGAGASEILTRSLIEGVLRRRHREQLAGQRIQAEKKGWWRATAAGSSDSRLLRDTVTEPLRALLGRDPRDVTDAENRYPFLPIEKRRRLAEIDLDYTEMEASAGSRSIDRLKSEINQASILVTERRNDVLAALSPEERAEYDLRFAGSAGIVARRFATSFGSEQAYRALKPLLEDFNRASRDLPRDDRFSAAYSDLQQRTMDTMVNTVGYEHALDYVWSGPGLYASTVRALQGLGLPVHTAAQLLQLACQTGDQARLIHADAAVAPDAKRAALQTLQDSVRLRFDALVPAGLRSQLPESAVSWFTMLAEGRYKGFHPTLLSSGLTEVAPLSVDSKPLPQSSAPTSLPRRPGSR